MINPLIKQIICSLIGHENNGQLQLSATTRRMMADKVAMRSFLAPEGAVWSVIKIMPQVMSLESGSAGAEGYKCKNEKKNQIVWS